MKSDPAPGTLVDLLAKLFDKNSRWEYRATNLIEEIERQLNTDKSGKLMTGLTRSNFSDIAILSHIWHETETFFPWSAGFEFRSYQFETGELPKDISDLDYLSKLWEEIPKLCHHVMPFDKLRYPIAKPATQVNVDQMRKAEATLDAYWQAVDNFYDQRGKGLNKFLTRRGCVLRTVYRTPVWSPPVSVIVKSTSSSEEIVSESPFMVSNIGDLPRRFEKVTIKDKVKNRGVVDVHQQPSPESLIELETASEVPRLLVSARALKTFKNIFPRTTNEQRGEFSWKDFLQAMSSAGCSILKMNGSAWQFTPDDSQLASIQFHDHHPLSRIPIAFACRMARRLTRNYGWTIDSSKVKE